MSPAIGIVGVAGVIALVVFGLRWLVRTAGTLGESTRAKALAGPAARLGLLAVPDDPLSDLPPFELLNTGTNRHASNVLRGSVSGRPVVVFDYSFLDGAKTDQRFRRLHYSQDLAGTTVCCVKGSWLSLPEFAMEPLLKPIMKQAEALVDQKLGDGTVASFVHGIMQAAEGMLQEAPGFEFSDPPDVPYRVRGKDEAAIRAAFTRPVLDYFREHPGWIVEGRGDWLLLAIALDIKGPVVRIQTGANVRQNGQLPADQLDALVRAATETSALFSSAASATEARI